jgi:hypothetical protein
MNKTDCHDITEIFLKVALNTITLTSDYPFGISKLFLNARLNFMIRECCYCPIVMTTGVSGYMAISLFCAYVIPETHHAQ